MPTSLCAAGALEPPQAAMVTRKATSTPRRGPIFAIEAPPVFLFKYLNSLGIGRHLSTSPITGPAEPGLQAGIAHGDQADDPVGGEDHDHDQQRPVGHLRPSVLEGGRNPGRNPGLRGDELAGDDRPPEGENAAHQRTPDRRPAPANAPTHHRTTPPNRKLP